MQPPTAPPFPVLTSRTRGSLLQVWELPEGGLKENLTEPVVDLRGHQRRVGIVEWHPTAENILFSAGFDYMVGSAAFGPCFSPVLSARAAFSSCF